MGYIINVPDTEQMTPKSIEDVLDIDSTDFNNNLIEAKSNIDEQIKFAKKYLKQDIDSKLLSNDYIFIREKLVKAISNIEVNLQTVSNTINSVSDPKMLMILIGSTTELSKVLQDMTNSFIKHQETHLKNIKLLNDLPVEKKEGQEKQSTGVSIDDILASESNKPKQEENNG